MIPKLATFKLLAALAAGACGAGGAEADKADVLKEGCSASRLAAIGDKLRADGRAGRLPGAVILVARNGKLVYSEVIGEQDPKSHAPMRRDSIFRIYSRTKPFVSVAVMMLAEQGRLQIGEPVSKYIPELKDLKVGVEKAQEGGGARLELVPAAREMTIQDLLRHTSGLTYGVLGKSLVKEEYGTLGGDTWDHANPRGKK